MRLKNHVHSVIRCCVGIAITIHLCVVSANENIFIIDTSWLAKQTSKPPELVILDVRPSTKFLQGHIDGAVNIPIENTFQKVGFAKNVKPVSEIQDLLGNAGISNNSTVVVYDAGDYIDAGRMFWILEVHGHHKIKLLNGGFPAWSQEKRPISTKAITPTPQKFIAAIQPRRLATKFNTRLALNNPNQNIIDARSKDEYLGKISKANRYGHIPTAISIPWLQNFETVDGISVIKNIEELKKLYNGIDSDKSVITYCNAGRHSSFTYFVLRQLGFDVSHYDGSWLEWGNDTKLPISKVRDN